MLDFPSSPTVGQKYPAPPVTGLPIYTWDGEKWTTIGGATTAGLAVCYDIAQALTAPQQQQARQNIYAAPFDAMAANGIQINGSMEVSQEKGGTGTPVTNAAPYILDGWTVGANGPSVLSSAQNTGYFAAFGFPYYLGVLITTADAALAAGSLAFVSQIIEGRRIAPLAWGTANAQPITVGFWTAHHRTGLYSVAARTVSGSRAYVATYTQNVADTQEYKTVTIPGDVAGAWPTDSTAVLTISFALATGANFTAPAANTWYSANYIGAPGQVNGIATTSDIFRLTGVVILPGTEAPSAARSPFVMRPYDRELILCKRYWEQVTGTYRFNTSVAGYMTVSVSYTVAKRSAPTCTFINGSSANSTFSAFATNGLDAAGVQFTGTPNADSYNYGFLVNADARL